MKTFPNPARAGFSLVLSLIILTLLAILVVGFLSSTAIDRATARAFASKVQAETVADTATNQAISMLREFISAYPDSATMWETLSPQAATGTPGGTTAPASPAFEGTVLYFYDRLPNDPQAKRRLLPLVSRVDAAGQLLTDLPVEKKAEALGPSWPKDGSTPGDPGNSNTLVDLNRPRTNGDVVGWIGSSPQVAGTVRTAPQPFRAQWVNVKEQVEAGREADARTIGRYAFWVEDESFKVNLNQLDSFKRDTERAENARLKLSADDLTKTPLPIQLAAQVPIQGLLRSARAPAVVNRDTFADSVKTARNSFFGKKLLELRGFNQLDTNYAIADEAKFLTTIFSAGLNVSRHGSQRLNLNGLGFDRGYEKTDAEIETQIKQVVETIRHHTKNATDLSNFGQRFYRTSTATNSGTLNDPKQVTGPGGVGTLYQDIYLYKVAANLRDYIDPDPQPTVIMTNGKVLPREAPTHALPFVGEGEDNNVWAQGKDGAPFLDEAVVRYRSKVTAGRFELKEDYYIEFWNMTDKVVTGATLGPKPFLRMTFQVPWLGQGGGGTILQTDDGLRLDDGIERSLVLDLSGVTFPPGAFTVITSDPDYASQPVSGATSPTFSGGYNKANIVLCPVIGGRRFYTGKLPTQATGIKPLFRDSGGQDYEVEVIMGNARGPIETHASSIAHGGGGPITSTGDSRDDWYGGTLIGNGTTPSQLSDPRTNIEQLIYTRFVSGVSFPQAPDQSRYGNTRDRPRFSLGYANNLYTNPQLSNAWPDYYRGWDPTPTGFGQNPDINTAPVHLEYVTTQDPPSSSELQRPLLSIGQLGDVFDPARVRGTVGTLGIGGSRGGGRTFRIGQRDDRLDVTTPDARSRQWAAWRLTDFLDTSNDLQLPGVININGLQRDNGAALRAACYGMIVRAVSRPATGTTAVQISDKALDSEETTATAGLKKLIDQAILRMTANDPTGSSYSATKPYFGPFTERGELSELQNFSAGSNLLTGVNMTEAFDRTREELVRRLLHSITTRGSIFTVYAVGQSIAEGPAPKRIKTVTGSHQTKVTFQLVPRKADGTDFRVVAETFDPTKPASVEARFAKPDHYDIQILQVGS